MLLNLNLNLISDCAFSPPSMVVAFLLHVCIVIQGHVASSESILYFLLSYARLCTCIYMQESQWHTIVYAIGVFIKLNDSIAKHVVLLNIVAILTIDWSNRYIVAMLIPHVHIWFTIRLDIYLIDCNEYARSTPLYL